jgi:hypothetical protein
MSRFQADWRGLNGKSFLNCKGSLHTAAGNTGSIPLRRERSKKLLHELLEQSREVLRHLLGRIWTLPKAAEANAPQRCRAYFVLGSLEVIQRKVLPEGCDTQVTRVTRAGTILFRSVPAFRMQLLPARRRWFPSLLPLGKPVGEFALRAYRWTAPETE